MRSMSVDEESSAQTKPSVSSQTIPPTEMATVKGSQQSERRISFSDPNKATPTPIQANKASRSQTTRLSSDLSPGITAEGLGTPFSTPLRSWTRDKTTWTSGLSSLGERAGRGSGGCPQAVTPPSETPARAAEASPDPMSLPEPPGPPFSNEGPTASAASFGEGRRARGGGVSPGKSTRRGVPAARPGFSAPRPSEDPNGSEASAHTPSFLNGLRGGAQDGEDDAAACLYKDGLPPFTRCASLGSRISAYDSARSLQIRAMLIHAERELAEVREDSVKRGMILESLRTALDRERTSVQALRMHHFQQMEEVRSEHDAQIKQLCEQIRVLKMVSETAMAEKTKADEEAVRRRKDMLAFLEKERAEKGFIMADYREQTEALIKEQGREITNLRSALDQIKEQYNKLATEHEVILNARDVLEGQFEEHKAQLECERVEGARRLRESQNRLISEKESLQNEIERIREEQLRESAKWQSKQQELLDQLQRAQEKVAAQEEGRSHTLESIRQAHRRELETVRKELESVKEAYNKQASEYRVDLEKAVQNEQKVSESLRQALEQVRREKEEAVADAYMQRDQLQSQHRGKISQQQAVMDALSKELAEQQRARKDAESNVEVLRLRAESVQRMSQETSRTLEALQIDQRTKERALEQAHKREIEKLEGRLRSVAADLTDAQQQTQQGALEQQRLRDELAVRSTALERLRAEQKETIERAEVEKARMSQDYIFREEEWGKALDQLRSSVKTMEEDRLRLERNLKEDDARLKAVAEEMAADRASLESTNKELREAKVLVDDLRRRYNKEQEINVELVNTNQMLTEELQKSKLLIDALENAVQMGLRRFEESRHEFQRQSAAHEAKLNELEQQHQAELVGLHLTVEQTRMESSRAHDLVATKEAALAVLREELATLSRNAALRESSLQEELENLKREHEEAMQSMDELLNGLRADLAKSQATCTEYHRELNNIHLTADSRYLDLEAAMERSEAARARLQEDSKYRDQLKQELQSTVRLLTTRLCSHEEEIKRLQEEVSDTNSRIQDAHTLIGRKDSTIGQLNAKLRAYESRGFLI